MYFSLKGLYYTQAFQPEIGMSINKYFFPSSAMLYGNFCNQQVVLQSISLNISVLYFSSSSLSNKTNLFGSYLAGLIEGDGTINVPNSLRNAKGKLLYPSIQIIFHIKDLPLANLIKSILGHGSIHIKSNSNACVLTINNFDGLLYTINLINGHFHTSKISTFHKLIDYFNSKGNNITKLPLSTNSFSNDAWLAGFIDAEGCFQIRNSSSKSACYFELVQRQIDVDNSSLFGFMSNLAFFLLCSIKSFKGNSNFPRYRVRTYSLSSNLNLIDYLSNFPLFSSKHLDFLAWKQAVLLIRDKKHLTSEGKILLSALKSSMNNSRTIFTWNHLSNFYKQ